MAESAPGASLVFPPSYVEGVSPSMKRLYSQMLPLVWSDLPFLLVGETGVGKDLIALTLHLSSPRREAPFVPVNCAAIPTDLLEAELFGIGDRVATGVAGRPGTFRRAEGGTLFLDEICEMPTALQVKLLRVLQERQLHPLGSPPVAVDIRVIGATNADVFALMDAGRFRRDLYFRIAGVALEIPPLRHRREDVPLLVESLLKSYSETIGKPVGGISERTLQALAERDWPGNVRELEHEVRRLVHLCPPGGTVDVQMLSTPHPARGGPWAPSADAAPASSPANGEPEPAALRNRRSLNLEAIEREAIDEALRRSRGRIGGAAELLGISRFGLRRRMERFGFPAPPPRAAAVLPGREG